MANLNQISHLTEGKDWVIQKRKMASQNKSSAKNSFGATWCFWKSLTFLLGSSKLQNVSQGHNTKEISNLDIIIFMFFLHIVRRGNCMLLWKTQHSSSLRLILFIGHIFRWADSAKCFHMVTWDHILYEPKRAILRLKKQTLLMST